MQDYNLKYRLNTQSAWHLFQALESCKITLPYRETIWTKFTPHVFYIMFIRNKGLLEYKTLLSTHTYLLIRHLSSLWVCVLWKGGGCLHKRTQSKCNNTVLWLTLRLPPQQKTCCLRYKIQNPKQSVLCWKKTAKWQNSCSQTSGLWHEYLKREAQKHYNLSEKSLLWVRDVICIHLQFQVTMIPGE